VDDQVKVRGYRIELGEVERAVAGQEKVEQAAVVVKERVGGERQLVAYVELESGSGGEEIARVRAGVRERLPEYMCPGVYVKLEKLPRSSSGKIDRRALAEMEWVEEGEGGYVGPGNEVEERLAGIWAGVLGRKRVGVRENFFELGGDSIVGIQIVARARQMGIEVTPKQLFQHQTIAELAAVAEVAEAWGGGRRGEEAEQGEVKGEAPLTPIQRWFFQQETDNVNYCNQAFLFVVGEEIRGEWVEEGLKKLVEQHDQLRARFKREGGEWKQWYAGTGESEVEVRRIDLSGEKAEEREARLRAVIEEEQRGLDIERGPLLRAAWIELGPERGRRLLVVVHHLGVDGVSWRIMLEDMESWYRQRAEGREGNLGLKTTSYKRWGEELERYGKSEELEREREYWEREEGREVEALPVDWGEGRNLAGDEKRVQRVLGEKATRELLGEAGRAYHTQVMELLVSALAGGLQRWRGQKRVRVELEGHGREEFVKGVDVTRTVGWFTSVYPVVVEWREGEGTGERVKRVKEEMRRIPQKGMGYGVLKYVGEGIRKNKESELLVNYLGQMDGSMGEGAMLRAAPEGSGRSVSEGMRRSSKVELNAVVLGGQLHMIWGYSGKQYREETIVELAEAYEQSLLEVIEHCLSPEAGGFTPADFTEAGLEQHELEYLLEKIDQIG
jgi:non-ribosomal peptide synthase protein (TIGR01720 family)